MTLAPLPSGWWSFPVSPSLSPRFAFCNHTSPISSSQAPAVLILTAWFSDLIAHCLSPLRSSHISLWPFWPDITLPSLSSLFFVTGWPVCLHLPDPETSRTTPDTCGQAPSPESRKISQPALIFSLSTSRYYTTVPPSPAQLAAHCSHSVGSVAVITNPAWPPFNPTLRSPAHARWFGCTEVCCSN
ncbi:hypothetical protein VTG60DRAFT_3061 [Thermothelomyces hinnuleus]